ncbi:hypothetical protein BGZ95_002496, partial [Linnemannia exigua]
PRQNWISRHFRTRSPACRSSWMPSRSEERKWWPMQPSSTGDSSNGMVEALTMS